eukprot:CAMPEP_0183755048 /NCGR_PEP_ID=MMETSP0739-20130205/3881_1 /TAXON_ID=385413 /ORGANISM="Thalassiosira miniscula, Strain CCMP1093" /LENGTH=423 /DNA_ID=CAMNT_0025991739 /DNA_START=107 /DNA_END=1378 /DNA_ORIENTATION=+
MISSKEEEIMDHENLIETVANAIVESDDTNEFNLRHNYENAIACLLQCNVIIQSLQVQLATKDEALVQQERQISSLEGRIIEMSFELASAKALEDEHRLIQRRMSEVSAVSSSSASDLFQQQQQRPMKTTTKPQQQQQQQSHKITLESCLRNSSFSSSRSNSKEFYKPRRTGMSASRRIGNSNNSNSSSTSSSTSAPRSRSRSTQRRTSSLLQNSQQVSQVSVTSSKSTSSMSSTSAASNSFGRNSFAALFQRRQQQASASMQWSSVSSSLQSSFQSSITSQENGEIHSSIHSRSSAATTTTNRLGQIGHFLLGTNEPSTSTNTATTSTTTKNINGGDATTNNLMGMKRSNSEMSSQSYISGVLFPVTSEEILAGCNGSHVSFANANSRSSRSRSRVGSSGGGGGGFHEQRVSCANEEWPEFQ